MSNSEFSHIPYGGEQEKYKKELGGKKSMKAVLASIGMRARGVQLDALRPGQRDMQVAAIIDTVGLNFTGHSLEVSKQSGRAFEVVQFRMLADAAIACEQLGSTNHNLRARDSVRESGKPTVPGSIEQFQIKSKVIDAFLGLNEQSEENWNNNGLLFGQRMDVLLGPPFTEKNGYQGKESITADERHAVLRLIPDVYKTLVGREQGIKEQLRAAQSRNENDKLRGLRASLGEIQLRKQLLQTKLEEAARNVQGDLKLEVIDAVMDLGNREQDAYMVKYLEPKSWDTLSDETKIHLMGTYSAATVYEAAMIAEIYSKCNDHPPVRDALLQKLKSIAVKSKEPWSDVDSDKLVPDKNGLTEFENLKEKRGGDLAFRSQQVIANVMSLEHGVSNNEAYALLQVAADLSLAVTGSGDQLTSSLENSIRNITIDEYSPLPSPQMIAVIPRAVNERQLQTRWNESGAVLIRKALLSVVRESEHYIGSENEWNSINFLNVGSGKKRQEALRAVVEAAKKMTSKGLFDKADSKKEQDRVSLDSYISRLKNKIKSSKRPQSYRDII